MTTEKKTKEAVTVKRKLKMGCALVINGKKYEGGRPIELTEEMARLYAARLVKAD